MRRSVNYVLFVAALVAAFIPLPAVFSAKPDIPTVNGIPGLFFVDELLRHIYPVTTSTPLPTQVMNWASATFNIGSVSLSLTPVPVWLDDSLATAPVILTPEGAIPASLSGPIMLAPESTIYNVDSLNTIMNALPFGDNLLGRIKIEPPSEQPIGVIGNVNTSPILGFASGLSVTVGTSAAVICPELPAGTRKIWITSNQDINIGAADITSSTGENFIPGNAPGFPFTVATTTPSLYFRAQSATATVMVYPALEP